MRKRLIATCLAFMAYPAFADQGVVLHIKATTGNKVMVDENLQQELGTKFETRSGRKIEFVKSETTCTWKGGECPQLPGQDLYGKTYDHVFDGIKIAVTPTAVSGGVMLETFVAMNLLTKIESVGEGELRIEVPSVESYYANANNTVEWGTPQVVDFTSGSSKYRIEVTPKRVKEN